MSKAYRPFSLVIFISLASCMNLFIGPEKAHTTRSAGTSRVIENSRMRRRRRRSQNFLR